MELQYNEYVISDDPRRIDVSTVIEFLATSYWGHKRSPEIIRTSIERSTCYGVYLYAKYGFEDDPGKFMRRLPQARRS